MAVIPHRPPIVAAKAVATLDVISGGRFIFGLGVGWFAEELEVLGVSFKDRAKISRTYLDTMKSLWTETRPRLTNASGQSVEVGFAPKPVQKPHPPLWFGGESRPALKRVAQQGDGWFPAFVSPEDCRKSGGTEATVRRAWTRLFFVNDLRLVSQSGSLHTRSDSRIPTAWSVDYAGAGGKSQP